MIYFLITLAWAHPVFWCSIIFLSFFEHWWAIDLLFTLAVNINLLPSLWITKVQILNSTSDVKCKESKAWHGFTDIYCNTACRVRIGKFQWNTHLESTNWSMVHTLFQVVNIWFISYMKKYTGVLKFCYYFSKYII